MKKLVEKQKKKHNWEFIFLGANIDAIDVAGKFGIGANRAMNYHSDSIGTAVNFKAVSSVISHFRDADCDCRDEAFMDEMVEKCCAPIIADYESRNNTSK